MKSLQTNGRTTPNGATFGKSAINETEVTDASVFFSYRNESSARSMRRLFGSFFFAVLFFCGIILLFTL